ncbi:MAG: MBL fold metallo-hydrolase, partial [Pseudomonadota bacterium]
LCDAGSGLRDFGNHCLRKGPGGAPAVFHILISHPHRDHLQGFPFFTPAYVPGNRISIYGCHEDLRKAFEVQQGPPFFPVDFNSLGADIDFVPLTPNQSRRIAGFEVLAKPQSHPGISYGYRLEREGKGVVYSTDSEHKGESDEDVSGLLDFFAGADLLIYDAQYIFAEACTVKEDWGHSNNVVGVELAQKAGVKHLCLFHHEPTSSDRDLDRLLEDTKKLASILGEENPVEVSVARDGMRVVL